VKKIKDEDLQYLTAMNAVVRIHAKGFAENNPKGTLDPRIMPQESWLGSGFFIKINNEEGYILTNSHVAKNALHLEIHSVLTSDEPFKVELVGLVETLEPDVALLKLNKDELVRLKKMAKIKKLPVLDFADSEKITRGVEVKAIGYPLGMVEPNMSGGEISNFISGGFENVERFVTDAAINPGNSGGPAVMRNSKVVGINTAIIVAANNIAFITPIHIVKNILPQLIGGKEVFLCNLGAYVQKNSKSNSLYLKQKSVVGIIVNKVFPNSLAKYIGLKANDIVLEINGNKIDRHGNIISEKLSRKKNMYDVLHSNKIGDSIKFKIYRNGKTKIITSIIKATNEDVIPLSPIVSKRKNCFFEGLLVQEVCSEILSAIGEVYEIDGSTLYRDFLEAHSKIIITAVDSDSQADELGFQMGDYITQVSGKRVTNIKSFMAIIKVLIKSQKEVVIKTSNGAIGVFRMHA
jgi:S1-C subfamily serine protease